MSPGAALAVSGLSKSFGGVSVITRLDMVVPVGQALGVVGPNGAGKSTLFNLISGDTRPDNGTVLLNGRDVTRQKPAWRCRAGVGRTYQIPRPFTRMSVYETALLGAVHGAGLRGRHASDAAVDALDRTGLGPLANRAAGGLGLLDRKRLELARALACAPTLLLMDEVAGGLTEPEVEQLVATVRQLRDGRLTLVWIEHVVHALTQIVDRLLCLTYGRVLADGDPDQVLRSPEVQKVYLGTLPDEPPTGVATARSAIPPAVPGTGR
jgi:branched-chain amino acid transport system ATP-binding protein